MRKTILLSSLFLTWLAPSAKAQVNSKFHFKVEPLSPLKLRYGVRVGAQVTSMTTGAPTRFGLESKNNFWNGQGGLVVDAAFGWLSVQPAVIFSQKGYRVKKHEYQMYLVDGNRFTRLRLNYLEVPVNLIVTVKGVQLFAGPYLGVALSGEYWDKFSGMVRVSESNSTFVQSDYSRKEKAQIGKSRNPNYNSAFSRFDTGYNVGIGYKLGPWQAQLSHMHGVVNTYPNSYTAAGLQAKNRGFQLNATYFFGQP
ncbi:outer membrane beta-barrel protein [Hymenobacter sp. GOD-10R]|uniref:outer membrane beta-barrel protein n=1 Tax=Hymenobacter sp. GOD-10R TaxID=3093922 RepID=UPI002D771DCE|nr:outer membrane beta-barrel protein [Hymenobacter sp. GOD-10R]WRQ28238.1 outer membrane beta-barrel protein [Hymenobacter sp. GOD-10R]